MLEIAIDVKLTARLQRVLSLAIEEASRRKEKYADTSLTLLATLYRQAGEGEGVGVRVLKQLGVQLDDLVTDVRAHIRDQNRNDESKVKLSSSVLRALDLAADEAKRLDHDWVDTGHFILGLVQAEKDLAASVLKAHKVTLSKARKALTEVLKR